VLRAPTGSDSTVFPTVRGADARLVPHKVPSATRLSSDWDDRWRTGGASKSSSKGHIDPASLWKGIDRFAREREAAPCERVWPEVKRALPFPSSATPGKPKPPP